VCDVSNETLRKIQKKKETFFVHDYLTYMKNNNNNKLRQAVVFAHEKWRPKNGLLSYVHQKEKQG